MIQGKWKQVKGSVKEKWGDLTDDDLDRIDGSKDQLTGKLQEKYGWTKDEAERNIDDHFRDRTI
ncbi:CsbD family protein [Paracoccus everestensis]|uniref:CsbD family protein n=1 Tax=Paracoccus everestensis TaxID=2903900 RepID=UPI001F206F43|nr:CsbD family protein [Paracoccus everestensis]